MEAKFMNNMVTYNVTNILMVENFKFRVGQAF